MENSDVCVFLDPVSAGTVTPRGYVDFIF